MYSSQTLTYANHQLLDKFDSVEKQFKIVTVQHQFHILNTTILSCIYHK